MSWFFNSQILNGVDKVVKITAYFIDHAVQDLFNSLCR